MKTNYMLANMTNPILLVTFDAQIVWCINYIYIYIIIETCEPK